MRIPPPIFALISALLVPPAFTQEKLEELVVVSSRVEMPLREVGASVSVIGREELELRGFQSLTDILRTQSGVAASNAGGPGKVTSVRIRGEESFRTLVLIDGIKVSDPTSPQVGPPMQHLTTSTQIEKVEILRGPQGFIYGADAGGVVNILTRSGAKGLQGQVEAEYGRHDSSLLSGFISGGNELLDAFVSVNDTQTDGFNARTSDINNEEDGYDNTTLHSKMGLNFFDSLRVQLVARDVTTETEFDNCGFPSTNQCIEEFDQTTTKISLDYTTGQRSHALAFSRSDIERVNFSEGVRAFVTSGDIQKAEYVGSQKFNQNFTVVFGGDFETESIDTPGDDLERDQTGTFAELQTSFSDTVYIAAGARYDDNDDFGEHTSIRISSAYIQPLTPAVSIKYRASFGTGFRAPSLSEIAYNTGPFAFGEAAETVLKEETSEGFDLGVELFFNGGAFIDITYFDQEIEDEILFDLVNFSGYLQEVGTSSSDGFEFSFELPLADIVSLQGNYTYNDSETSGELQRLRRPQKLANLGLRFNILENRLKLLASVRTARDSQDEIFGVGRVKLDNYEVVDISANYAALPTLEVFARVENATEEHYQEVSGFNTSGAAVYTGMRYKF